MREPMRMLLRSAALSAAGCLALTGGHALSRMSSREVGAAADTARGVAEGDARAGGLAEKCAIYHARFGGTRARLIMVMHDDVANYVVMEVSKGSRVPPSVPIAWLRGAFGGAEASWLGEFASPESALARAALLCPESIRCRIGEENCGPRTPLF